MTEQGHTLNINVGILGHVDSGKTTLAKALSTQASTAAFDKNPQSRTRGITLDLGFSAFNLEIPELLKGSGYDKLQVTLVDCPGHASLVKTIIGGAQIIDLMLLVIDATKGIQTQTAECLVIGEITAEKMIIVLNKIDLYPEETRASKIEKMITGLRKTLSQTKFCKAPIVPVSANVGGANIFSDDSPLQKTQDLTELLGVLRDNIELPKRSPNGDFLFAVDHCFGILGKGTIITGTVLRGSVAIGDIIEIASATRKVKSMQMFKKSIQKASQGDRLGICVTQFDPENFERGLAYTPGTIKPLTAAIASCEKVRFFKGLITSKSKVHVTVGHHTVMATVSFFGFPKLNKTKEHEYTDFTFSAPYEHYTTLLEAPQTQFVLLEFETPLESPPDAVFIASRLDAPIDSNLCRIAFHGVIKYPIINSRYKEEVLGPKGPAGGLKVFKWKEREGQVERIVDERTIIGKGLFKKDIGADKIIGLKVFLSTGPLGRIESSFGVFTQTGKFKVYFTEGIGDEVMATFGKGKGKKDEKMEHEEGKLTPKLLLRFKKFVYDQEKKMVQD